VISGRTPIGLMKSGDADARMIVQDETQTGDRKTLALAVRLQMNSNPLILRDFVPTVEGGAPLAVKAPRGGY